MLEKVMQLFSFIAPALNNPDTSLEEKIELIATSYIDMLLKNPDLPLFVLSEIRSNPERFGKMVQSNGSILQSYFVRQLAQRNKAINPLQLFLNFLGMMVFPFVAKPIFMIVGQVNEDKFVDLMEQRKTLIPQWMKMILE